MKYVIIYNERYKRMFSILAESSLMALAAICIIAAVFFISIKIIFGKAVKHR